MGPCFFTEMSKILPILSTAANQLTFETAIQPVREHAFAKAQVQGEEEFQKGLLYLKHALKLYHQPGQKLSWHIRLAQSTEELYAIWQEKADTVLFSYCPPSLKPSIARRIKQTLLQTGLVRSAGKGTGNIVYIILK
jgi:hypothetical protein